MVLSIVVFEAPEFKAGVPANRRIDRISGKRETSSKAFSGSLEQIDSDLLHEKVYPKDTDYFWYRSSRHRKNVGNSSVPLSSKYLKCVFLAMLSGVAGSGQITWLIM